MNYVNIASLTTPPLSCIPLYFCYTLKLVAHSHTKIATVLVYPLTLTLHVKKYLLVKAFMSNQSFFNLP
jgi:hypothetical protein